MSTPTFHDLSGAEHFDAPRLLRKPETPIHAVLFDLDGTIIDSEPLYKQANKVFLQRHGIVVPDDRFEQFVGIGARNFISIMTGEFGLKGETSKLLAEMDQCYIDLARENTVHFSEMVDFVRTINELGIPHAIASGSTVRAIRESLSFAHVDDLFPVIVSSMEVQRGKPAPDVFIEAARRIGAETSECLVVEDSRAGVAAGLAAGMTVLALPAHAEEEMPPEFFQVNFLVPGGPGHFKAKSFVSQLRTLGCLQ